MVERIKVKFHRENPQVLLPERESGGAGAYDVRAFLKEAITLEAGERAAIPTGLRVELPEDFILSVRPRSGLAIHHGITLVNSPGTVDSDYRGEIKILIINLGKSGFRVENGERIAQLVLERAYPIEWVEAQDELRESERGEKGFGSTGRV